MTEVMTEKEEVCDMSQTLIGRIAFEPVDEMAFDYDYALVVDQTIRAIPHWSGSGWREGEEDKGDTLHYRGWALSIDELGVLPRTVPHDESPKSTGLSVGYLIDFNALAAVSHGLYQLEDLEGDYSYLYQESGDFEVPHLQPETAYPYFSDEDEYAQPPLISSAEVVALLNAPDIPHLTDSRGFEGMSLKEVVATTSNPGSRWIIWDLGEVNRNLHGQA